MDTIENPIINSPFHEPERHFKFDARGVITGETADGRRRSLYFTPIPGTKKLAGQLDLDVGERVEENQLINQIREQVSLWRRRGYPGVTATTRRLIDHWNEIDDRVRPLFFCQREAIETAIFLTEVAPKEHAYFTNTLAQYANAFNSGLYRQSLKMATGTGKTVVMSLLIVWHTLNKARSPQDSRFSDQFLVVAPGITIRDRLRVLEPSDPDNYYDQLDLVPAGLRDHLSRATVRVVNFHQLDRREKVSAPATTKRLLGSARVFTETPGEMANRILRPFSGTKQIVVLNDEGHHCYQDRPDESELDPDVDRNAFGIDDLKGDEKAEAKEREAAARLWHTGLVHIAAKRGIKTVYDLSATPFYLSGSGWQEGTLFQWVVSDFALTDAIECGIVKIPRVPVSDDVQTTDPTYRALWSKVGRQLPTGSSRAKITYPLSLPPELETAIQSLYGDYAEHFEAWQQAQGNNPDSVPPVFIVVAANTNVSKLVFEWMSGYEEETADGTVHRHPGNLPLFNNVDQDGNWISRPVSVILDSVALDSGEQLPPAFRDAASAEISRFRREVQKRDPGATPDQFTDQELLREVMNTVGTPHTLGAGVRAVTSVSMLTEGWDANTVTHILGVRAFGTQLLCEQVVGRGLRRVSYELNEHGHFDPEYADVYGVPFAFVPVAGQRTADPGAENHTFVHTDEARSASMITFPRVVGYRYSTASDRITASFTDDHQLTLGSDAVPTSTDIEDITGIPEVHTLDRLKVTRMQAIRYAIADRVCRSLATDQEDARPWLFPQVLPVVATWMDQCVNTAGNAFPQLLGLSAYAAEAADLVLAGITHDEDGNAHIQPILDRHLPSGSTRGIGWWTKRSLDDLWITNAKSHVSHVVAHSGWELEVAATLERMPEVRRYVKNDHLDFTIPYVMNGIQKSYVTDFIAVIDTPDGPVNLLIEVTGERRRDKEIKVTTTREKWVPAVNNHREFGRWDLLEITDPAHVELQIRNHLRLEGALV